MCFPNKLICHTEKPTPARWHQPRISWEDTPRLVGDQKIRTVLGKAPPARWIATLGFGQSHYRWAFGPRF